MRQSVPVKPALPASNSSDVLRPIHAGQVEDDIGLAGPAAKLRLGVVRGRRPAAARRSRTRRWAARLRPMNPLAPVMSMVFMSSSGSGRRSSQRRAVQPIAGLPAAVSVRFARPVSSWM